MNNKVVRIILTILGFSTVATSCESFINDSGGGMTNAYGCPSADYSYNIDVLDSDTFAPIEGIRVSIIDPHTQELWDEATETIYTKDVVDTLASGISGSDGTLTLTLKHQSIETREHTIVAEDIDGEENGGDYKSATQTIRSASMDYATGNYKGTTSFLLEKK